MTDREKIISALENCSDPAGKCRDCPYEECERFEKSISEYPDELIRKAVELLKEQEPRVLSKRYMQAWNKKEINKRPPVVLECRETGYMRWVIETLYREEIDAIGEGDMRFWSARPTDEQRKAVKWDD